MQRNVADPERQFDGFEFCRDLKLHLCRLEGRAFGQDESGLHFDGSGIVAPGMAYRPSWWRLALLALLAEQLDRPLRVPAGERLPFTEINTVI